VQDELRMENFSISCTVLGKQVEYAVLPALSQIAAQHGLVKLVFLYRRSARNQPTLAYLKTAFNDDGEHRFVLPVVEVDARISRSAIAPGAWNISVTDEVKE